MIERIQIPEVLRNVIVKESAQDDERNRYQYVIVEEMGNDGLKISVNERKVNQSGKVIEDISLRDFDGEDEYKQYMIERTSERGLLTDKPYLVDKVKTELGFEELDSSAAEEDEPAQQTAIESGVLTPDNVEEVGELIPPASIETGDTDGKNPDTNRNDADLEESEEVIKAQRLQELRQELESVANGDQGDATRAELPTETPPVQPEASRGEERIPPVLQVEENTTKTAPEIPAQTEPALTGWERIKAAAKRAVRNIFDANGVPAKDIEAPDLSVVPDQIFDSGLGFDNGENNFGQQMAEEDRINIPNENWQVKTETAVVEPEAKIEEPKDTKKGDEKIIIIGGPENRSAELPNEPEATVGQKKAPTPKPKGRIRISLDKINLKKKPETAPADLTITDTVDKLAADFEQTTPVASDAKMLPTENQSPARNSERSPSPISLNDENRGFFSRMSERAKELLGGLYERIGNSPLIGKFRIAYNQVWMDNHEQNVVQLKKEMDRMDAVKARLSGRRDDLQTQIQKLTAEGRPGVESRQLKLRKIDAEISELQNKKDRTQTKLETADNKLKLRTNRRDAVADTLIGNYSEHLQPMESKLDELVSHRDQIDLNIAITKASHDDLLARLQVTEERLNKEILTLREDGSSERKINRDELVKDLRREIAEGRAKIKKETEELNKKKASINEKIAKADAKAAPYRDKKAEIVRIKDNRPLNVEVPAREEAPEFKSTERIRVNTRRKAKEVPVTPPPVPETQVTTAEKLEKSESKGEDTVENFAMAWTRYMDQEQVLDRGQFAVEITSLRKAVQKIQNLKMTFDKARPILLSYMKTRLGKKFNGARMNTLLDQFSASRAEQENKS